MRQVDWSAEGEAKLVTLERRDNGAVKEIARVERAVAQELVAGAVKLILARAGHCVNYSAGGSSIISRGVSGDDREFLNRIDPQRRSDDVARSTARIVVD